MRTSFIGLALAATGLGGLVGCLVGWSAGNWLMFNLGAISVVCSAPLMYLLIPNPLAAAVGSGLEKERRSRRPASYRPPMTPPTDESNQLIEQVMQQGRTALLLRPQIVEQLSEDQLARARESFESASALVPLGDIAMSSGRPAGVEEPTLAPHIVSVETYYLDRCPVTNAEYKEFVAAGGYEQMALWEQEIWAGVVEFIDKTGHPGPRLWAHGTYPPGEDDHPVVGISWFEAAAYARWVGKRLPSDAEWVKAAAWPVPAAGKAGLGRKFPWGEALDRERANLWGGAGATLPVTEHASGTSVGGVSQMIGNVWEWTAGRYGAWDPKSSDLDVPTPLRSLRGGAFDTYFDSQATCQFQSGDTPLARKHNIGFRCAVSLCDVALSLTESPREQAKSAAPGPSVGEAPAPSPRPSPPRGEGETARDGHGAPPAPSKPVPGDEPDAEREGRPRPADEPEELAEIRNVLGEVEAALARASTLELEKTL